MQWYIVFLFAMRYNKISFLELEPVAARLSARGVWEPTSAGPGKVWKMEKLLEVLQKPLEQKEVELDDLPDLSLYMDQIITLFADKTQAQDGLLTKTMINNYSKEGLLKPIKGKKYSKEHVLQMLLIYRLKQTLSIQQIKGVMQRLNEEAQTEEESSVQVWEKLYGGYLASRETNGQLLAEMLEALLARDLKDCVPDTAQLLLQLSWISYMTKRMCDVLVERSFPLPDKEKKKEK